MTWVRVRARRLRWGAAIVALALTVASCGPRARPSPSRYEQVTRAEVLSQTIVPVYGFRIARTYPHDPTAYTEGLTIHDGFLYEGTGLYGESKLRKLDLTTGTLIDQRALPAKYFGEGITVLGDRVFQLTYESNVGFVYDRATFEPKGSFRYASQGWGLTTDGTRLIMSNGSAALIFIDPTTMETTGYVVVSRDEGPVGFLNELEYIDGKVFANIWQTDLIVVASPETGKVLAWIDLTGLNPEPDRLRYPFVLNGIARDPVDGRLVVTGKTWPRLYAIDLIPLKNAQPLRPGTLP